MFIHCSASDRAEHDDVEIIRNWHVEGNGWSGIGYHYFIKKDGEEVQPGRSLERIPAAQKGNNTATIAICLRGLAVENFTVEQYRSLIDLCNQIEAAYGGMISFHGHCEVSAKACPVFPYAEVLGLYDHGAMELSQTTEPAIAAPRPVLRLMDRGPHVEELQQLLNAHHLRLAADGIFGQATRTAVIAFQRESGLHPDGIVGGRTWARLTG